MTKNTSRKKYTSVFKTQAVEMAALRGDISAVAQELQINETNLRRWIGDCDGYYQNTGSDLDPDSPSWQLFADALQAAKIYE